MSLLTQLRPARASTDGPSPSTGKHVKRIMSDLPRCDALRSLSLHYDRRLAYMTGVFPAGASRTSQPSHTPAPFFLERLADVLSTPGAAPLPLLESISLVFYSPISWLSGFEAAFARLAETLVGDADGSIVGAGRGTGARRYPRFSHLHVRISILEIVGILFGDKGMEEERRQQEVERVNFVLPMLTGFVQAGVDVEVVCD